MIALATARAGWMVAALLSGLLLSGLSTCTTHNDGGPPSYASARR